MGHAVLYSLRMVARDFAGAGLAGVEESGQLTDLVLPVVQAKKVLGSLYGLGP